MAAAAEIRSFTVTIPAGTQVAAPVTTSVSFPARVVTGVHWSVPPGPSGLMGWRLSMSGGVAVIPTGGGWIIADNDADTWELLGQPDSGGWEVTGYNTDIYDHAVFLDFLLDLPAPAPAASVLAAVTPASGPASSLAASVPAGIPGAG